MRYSTVGAVGCRERHVPVTRHRSGNRNSPQAPLVLCNKQIQRPSEREGEGVRDIEMWYRERNNKKEAEGEEQREKQREEEVQLL